METARRKVNLDDVSFTGHESGQRFEMRRKKLGAASGGEMLGCSYFELAPGKTAFPYHWHAGNEEAIFILEGQAQLRTPSGADALRAGDYVTFPRGPEGAHQLSNPSEQMLRYLCLSTMVQPEVLYYPDSDKIGAIAGSPPGGSGQERTILAFLPARAAVGYWEGEE